MRFNKYEIRNILTSKLYIMILFFGLVHYIVKFMKLIWKIGYIMY